MIKIVPAIDIIGGKCVRLSQGDYGQKTIYNNNPLEVARHFEDAGIKRLHLVDLDGAKKGSVVNLKVLEEIASKTKLIVDFGGGIKSDADMESIFKSGAAMATVGSLAASDKEKVLLWLKKYGTDKIIIGADSKDGKIAVAGWQETTGLEVHEFINQYVSQGASMFLCTDISKDGMMQGSSLELYRELRKENPKAKIIASGGITHVMEINTLNMLGVDSVIIGKAYYEGLIKLEDLKKFLV
jgi:phosphoribosylformimino-5-aminoimidazole carboxamide ribotide isomerase